MLMLALDEALCGKRQHKRHSLIVRQPLKQLDAVEAVVLLHGVQEHHHRQPLVVRRHGERAQHAHVKAGRRARQRPVQPIVRHVKTSRQARKQHQDQCRHCQEGPSQSAVFVVCAKGGRDYMQGRPVKLLVICSNRENYFKLLGGRADVAVDQAPWLDVVGVVSFTDSLVVHLGPQKEPFTGTPQTGARSFSPDIVLLRSFVLGAPGHDWRTLMAGFMHANVECINSLDSFAFSVEKEKLWGRMRQCRDDDPTFPLISDCYYSGSRVASFFNESGFPLVVKLGSASQGVGKSQVKDAGGWKDTVFYTCYLFCCCCLNWVMFSCRFWP